MWEFEVGQLVVCVNDKFEHRQYGEKLPTLYNIYTIREICEWKDGQLAFRLKEIVNKKHDYCDIGIDEMWFYAFRFRPVKPTNIDLFKSMLVKVPTSGEIEYFTDDMSEIEKNDAYAL